MERKTVTITKEEYDKLKVYKKLVEEKLEGKESEEFWKLLSQEEMKRAWSKEDEIWEKIYSEEA